MVEHTAIKADNISASLPRCIGAINSFLSLVFVILRAMFQHCKLKGDERSEGRDRGLEVTSNIST